MEKKIKWFVRRLGHCLIKPFHDFALIFYDDTIFEAMSLPRVILGLGAGMMVVTWGKILFCGGDFKYFPELTVFCSTSMVPYSVKKIEPAIKRLLGKNDKSDGGQADGN